MLPPQLNGAELSALPLLLLQTAAIAVFGTALGASIGFFTALIAARTIVPFAVVAVTRRLLDTARAIPEVVWGLILVVSVGIGPIAGILALGFHSAGVLGKLYAESFENVVKEPVASIAATGASTVSTIAYAIVPLAFGPLAIHTLFRLEWNVRAAAVVGMIGAGGIGQALFNAQQLFFYKTMVAYVLITWAIVLAFDILTERLRGRELMT
jgi:phosphonate transport system permease protein